MMKLRPLCVGGPSVTSVGLGTWPIGGGMGALDRGVAIATIRHAIDSGITFIDTAQGYFESESIVGEALRDGFRDRCFLATKVTGDYTPAGIAAPAEQSLRRLGTDVIDLYQIHKWDPVVPVEESMAALVRLQEEGKVREIGVSNFSAPQMELALAAAPFAANQYAWSLFDREIERKVAPFCRSRGIGIVAHSCLGKGLLGGRYRKGHRFADDDERSRMPQFARPAFGGYLAAASALEAVAADLGCTLAQLALAWILREPGVACVLVGAKSPSQVSGFLGVDAVSVPDAMVERIDRILAEAPAEWSRG